MIDKHIKNININPFWGGIIIQAFHNGYNKEECPLNLHYTVLPIVMYKDSRKIFENITIRASLTKIVDENPITFSELQNRIWDMRRLTNMSLVNLNNSGKISLKSDVEIIETIDYQKFTGDTGPFLRAASYLGKLLRELSVLEVYKILKVIP
jgi:hypothetical protein